MTTPTFPDGRLEGIYKDIYTALTEHGIVAVPEDDINVASFRTHLYDTAKQRGWIIRTALSKDGNLYVEIIDHPKTLDRYAKRRKRGEEL